MTFDKKEYWKQKKDNIGSKRKKPNITPSGDAQIMFLNGKMVTMNRANRRLKEPNNIFTREGFIEYLSAIKITRKKAGKIKHKYVKIDSNKV